MTTVGCDRVKIHCSPRVFPSIADNPNGENILQIHIDMIQSAPQTLSQPQKSTRSRRSAAKTLSPDCEREDLHVHV